MTGPTAGRTVLTTGGTGGIGALWEVSARLVGLDASTAGRLARPARDAS